MHWQEGSTAFIGLLAVLSLIAVVVVLGNSLVIIAVLTYPKLRSSVNNSFIASLAAADFLLGVTVLPFSAMNEAMGKWIFGSGMCTAWLAIDVWMCTASIYHLCVISFDRYLAVAFPLKYPNLMSHFRCRTLILLVWIVSFLICFPPLVGWQSSPQGANSSDWTEASSLMSPIGNESQSTTCDVVGANSTGYVVYSSLGSFFIPMIVMVFFYIQVFKAAKRFNNAIRTGIIDTNTPEACASSALRVHRGTGIQRQESAQSMNSLAVPSQQKRARFAHSRGKLAASSFEVNREKTGPRPTRSECDVAILSSLSSTSDHSIRSVGSEVGDSASSMALSSFLRKSAPVPASASSLTVRSTAGVGSPVVSFAERKNMRMAFRILNREAKAAKTLAIIVGAFIMCWMPFFASYLASGFCPSTSCIPDDMFDVFVWVGYFNSALNPVIYAMFSKDYCHAFKKLLRCQLKARKERQKGIINFLTSLYIQGSSSERESLYMTEINLHSTDTSRDCSSAQLVSA